MRTSEMPRTPWLSRLREIANQQSMMSLAELREHGIHHQIVKRAVDLGLLIKLDRGLYQTASRPLDFERRITLACKRVPHGIVCLESALRFYRFLDLDSDVIWMAIDRKARKPAVKGSLGLRFVRFSGDALTQGVVNTRIEDAPVRVYSVAKTVADCLKYRNKIGVEVAIRNLRESVRQKKCSRERLRHFARICRVEKFVRWAHSSG